MIGALLLKLAAAARLATAITSACSDVPAGRIPSAALAIILASGTKDPFLVAAIGCTESKLLWRAANGPVAGPMQVRGPVPRTEIEGYREGVRALGQARAYCARRGTPTTICALAGFASGPAGIAGRWYARPRVVLAVRDQLVRRARALWPIGGGA